MPSDLFDHEMERAAIGTLADYSQLDVGRAALLADQLGLTVEDFHLPAHSEIYGAVLALLRDRRPADLLSVQTALPKTDRKRIAAALMGVNPPEPSLPGYARTLADLSLRRRVVALGRDLATAAADTTADAAAALSKACGSLAGITRRSTRTRTLAAVLGDVVRERAEMEAGRGTPILPTGLAELDAVIGGLQPTLTVVGAHPGVGKSAFLGAIIRNVARAGSPTGVFSLEDQASWLAWRYLALESGINQFVLRTRPLSDEQHHRFGSAEASLHRFAERVVIDDRTGLTPREVVQTARDLVVNRGVRALFVDHLGELRYENRRSDRYDLDVAEGLSDLRGLAKSYGVPVICATHLRREAKEPPSLFDFANAAAIERQSRVALALTRPAGGEVLSVHVLKHTNGKAGVSVDLPFISAAGLVGELAVDREESEAA